MMKWRASEKMQIYESYVAVKTKIERYLKLYTIICHIVIAIFNSIITFFTNVVQD